MRISEIDLAWAAGIFEGEGSVRITKADGLHLPGLVVEVVNTDHQLLMWFQARWSGYLGEKHHASARGQHWRPYWCWQLKARQAAAFLEYIQPYLKTDRVKRKVVLAREFQHQKVITGPGPRQAIYREAQTSFYCRMKVLNQRGVVGQLPLRMPTEATAIAAEEGVRT